MLIVSSPTDKWFKEAIRTCKESLTVASPFVGDYLPSALAAIDRPIECTLLTRTLLADFASGSSDFEAVVKVARRFGGVLSLRGGSFEGAGYVSKCHLFRYVSESGVWH